MIRSIRGNISENDPLKRNLGLMHAFLKFEEGKPDEGLKELENLKRGFAEPSYEAYLFRLYFKLGNYKKAEELLKVSKVEMDMFKPESELLFLRTPEEKIKVLKSLSKRYFVSKRLIFAYLEVKKWKEAEKLLLSDKYLDLKWILAIPPVYVVFGAPISFSEASEILTAKGIIEYRKGNKEKAKELFEEALRYAEQPLSLFSPLYAESLLTPKAYLGMIYYEMGKEAMARQYLEDAFSKNVPFFGDEEAKKVAEKLSLVVRRK
ncbi:tetratricopeptide repeat protein [bacterium]|nr:tetratricopeptide repeat protein [bacterium]